MLHTAELLRQTLVPFLWTVGLLLGALFSYLIIRHAVIELFRRRRQRAIVRYRPLIDSITERGLTSQARDQLRRIPARARRVVTSLLLAPLQASRGDVVAHVRDAAVAMGLTAEWRADLESRRWWRRADGVRALGSVREAAALPLMMRALTDPHEQVRAGAVDALGRLGDPSAIPVLLGHLADGSHYQRARVIDALRNLGPAVTPAVAQWVVGCPERACLAADVLGLIGTVAAVDPLLSWCSDARGDVRAAALKALGSLGLDDRGYYYALRALGDADPQARAMAARALGRARREEAVSYLAERLDDEWLPAAQAAGALRRLGASGLAALQARANDQGHAGDLARQMLWSLQPAAQ